jgi:hypothetical protein
MPVFVSCMQRYGFCIHACDGYTFSHVCNFQTAELKRERKRLVWVAWRLGQDRLCKILKEIHGWHSRYLASQEVQIVLSQTTKWFLSDMAPHAKEANTMVYWCNMDTHKNEKHSLFNGEYVLVKSRYLFFSSYFIQQVLDPQKCAVECAVRDK